MKNENLFITGGHFTPAISIYKGIEEYNKYNLFYIGVKHTILFDKSFSQEYIYCKENNMKFLSINTGKLYRYINLNSILSFLKIPLGFIQSIYYLIKYDPLIIITFGSYVSVPIIISGRMLNKKIYSHIQTIKPGISDKIAIKYSDKIFLSWMETEEYIKDRNKIIYIGDILREEIFTNNTHYFNFKNNDPILYITGGNQGSHLINQIVLESIEKLLEKYNIIHQLGSNSIYNDFDKSIKIKNNLNNRLKEKYIPEKNIWGDKVGEALNKSALVIGRSGANTVYEILALNKKAIFIPLTKGNKNDQIYNSKIACNYSDTIDILEENELNFNNLDQKITILLSKKNMKDLNLPIDAKIEMLNYIFKK